MNFRTNHENLDRSSHGMTRRAALSALFLLLGLILCTIPLGCGGGRRRRR